MVRHSARAPVLCALALAALAGAPPAAGADPEKEASPPTVKWRDFRPEVIAEAREASKLILLWIPAPWGHWDRLMADVTMTDPRVVSLLNDRYVPVKVDPLLRPDVDRRYNLGGWPTTAFLLPHGSPMVYAAAGGKLEIAGGTYYTPDGLAFLLESHGDWFAANRETAEEISSEFERRMLEAQEVSRREITPDLLEVAITRFLVAYREWWPDPGIRTPHHPDADSVALGLYYYLQKGNTQVRDVSIRLLTDMARGGIRDHLQGGFHRYARDAAWRVPSFEKTLAVNADMLRLYADVWRLTGNERYLAIADATASWALGTLRAPEGWFFAYQASGATGEDGDFYTWTRDEVKALLTEEEAQVAFPAFDIGEWGDLPDTAPRRNVIFLYDGPVIQAARTGRDVSEITGLLESATRKLSAARARREAPPVGKILLTDANAAMVEALLRSGELLGRSDWRSAGLAALDHLRATMRDRESGLMFHARAAGGVAAGSDQFADQVEMTRALIAAYESTGRAAYLEEATALARVASDRFAYALGGGWGDRIHATDLAGRLSWPVRVLRDNARFAEALLHLHYLTGEAADGPLRKRAGRALESWADEFTGHGEKGSPFGLAAHRFATPPLEVILAGPRDAEGFDPLRDEGLGLVHPWKTIRHLPAGTPTDPRIRDAGAPPGPSAWLCLKDSCIGPLPPESDLLVSLGDLAARAGSGGGVGQP